MNAFLAGLHSLFMKVLLLVKASHSCVTIGKLFLAASDMLTHCYSVTHPSSFWSRHSVPSPVLGVGYSEQERHNLQMSPTRYLPHLLFLQLHAHT
jgi:hypothetical protein